MTNSIKTAVLMALMTGLILFFGKMLGGQNGLIAAFAFSILLNFGMYWFSAKIVLKSYHATEVSEKEEPRLVGIVRRLATQAQLPMPKVYIIPGDSPNAFATGRNPQNAAVAVTQGILRLLSDDELEGVISHELAHVRHRDILIGTVAAAMAGTITFIAYMARFAMFFGGGSGDRDDSSPIVDLLLILLAPVAAMLIQMAISRSREYAADEGGAHICQRPLSLAQALRKLEREAHEIPMKNAGTATAHMFILNPLTGGGIAKLFSTHPATNDRIARLEKIASGGIR
jgi:heat shock protein HtpX